MFDPKPFLTKTLKAIHVYIRVCSRCEIFELPMVKTVGRRWVLVWIYVLTHFRGDLRNI